MNLIQHPHILTGKDLGRQSYVSRTCSDRGWLTMPSLKLGPGGSARSYTANEFIFSGDKKWIGRVYTTIRMTS
ncbi:hypothetical protein [Sphingobacterium detergens]